MFVFVFWFHYVSVGRAWRRAGFRVQAYDIELSSNHDITTFSGVLLLLQLLTLSLV